MKINTPTEEQIILILREAETGEQAIGSIRHALDIAKTIFYAWRKKYGDVDVTAVKRLHEAVLGGLAQSRI